MAAKGTTVRELAEEQRRDAEDLDRAKRALISEPSSTPKQVVATDYLHTRHPDTGIDVTFVPGEALPDWAADLVGQRDKNQ